MSMVLKGYGYYLPKNCVKNENLPPSLNTTDEWIRTRTGITQRYMSDDTETVSFMGAKAAEKALQHANLTADEIDLILLATTTADDVFPASAVRIQHLLQAKHAVAFDLQAACAGFVYALHTAFAYAQSNMAKRILVIGSEKMTKLLNWQDRTTAVLFGDGAGAWVFDHESSEPIENAHFSSSIYSDPHNGQDDLLYVRHHTFHMDGREVYRHAITKMGDAVITECHRQGLTLDQIDWIIPHQANRRIIEGICERYEIPLSKMLITIHEHANTSSATIPLAFHYGMEHNLFKANQKILLTALGSGFTWGACLLSLSKKIFHPNSN